MIYMCLEIHILKFADDTYKVYIHMHIYEYKMNINTNTYVYICKYT